MDFFVVVDDAAKQRYLDAIDWLRVLCQSSSASRNSVDGRKVLFTDGLFAEYAGSRSTSCSPARSRRVDACGRAKTRPRDWNEPAGCRVARRTTIPSTT
jgi:hypothetical protein